MEAILVILAGGASSRMKKSLADGSVDPETIKKANSISKGLIPLGDSGNSLLDYLIKNAVKAGYKNIILVTGEDAVLFHERFGGSVRDNIYNGVKIHFATQFIPQGREKPFGTADALFQCLQQYPELCETFFSVCNSDNLYSEHVLRVMLETDYDNALIAYDRDALGFDKERISGFAVMKFDHEHRLIDILEKPEPSIVDTYRDDHGKVRVSMNIFRFSGKDIYAYLEHCPVNPVRNEKELPTAVLNMVAGKNGEMYGVPVSEKVPDLTSKSDIRLLTEFLAKEDRN
ncbi:sugar phosphate nucleotidyltransferase [Robertkochia solimangrovi]|uniref:sugar phosphate nucleotidyltransferase n=1 Tax=Robertkochia solimangrovi TaxID=2213046 RepID=UPI0011806801|nr:sugar phosphate nucleotidyltransferase [Robertkochia solimangrovi]TRZ44303.1 nucleotidyltransferase [Robertkochia solimangrovi]